MAAAVWGGIETAPGRQLGMGRLPPAEAATSLAEVVERVQAACAQTQDLSARFQQLLPDWC